MLRCPNHTKITDYSLEFKMCGEIGRDLFPRISHVLQIHDEDLTKDVLRLFPLPQLDVDGKTFLQINECQRLIDNGSSLEDDLKDLKMLRREFKVNEDEISERKI